jgi:phosphate transport system protein
MHQLTVATLELSNSLLEMGSLVESAVRWSVEALADRNERAVERVFANERRINELEVELDDRAFRLLALHQPVARDLRFLMSALKVTTDLERVGDLALNVARRALSLLREESPENQISQDVILMARRAASMLARALIAFLDRDMELARRVLHDEQEVDWHRDHISQDLLRSMNAGELKLAIGVELLFIVRSLERIADHATNIAEDVIFLVQGVDIRHRSQGAA